MEDNQNLFFELKGLRAEIAKGAVQAEAGNFSKGSVRDMLEELNRYAR